MKTISEDEAQSNLGAVLESSQEQGIVILRGGRPCALVVGIESYDTEDLALANSQEFWRTIQERRRSGNSVPLSQVESRLRARERDHRAKGLARAPAKKTARTKTERRKR